MKRHFIFIILSISFPTFSQEEYHHCYLEEKSISIGGAYSTEFVESEHLINVRVYYNPTEKICFGPEYSYLFSARSNYQELGFVGHYIFDLKAIGLFPLLGFNYGNEADEHERTESWGIKGGLGIHRNFKRFITFTEGGVLVNNFETSPFLSIGLLYMIKLQK